MSYLCIRRMYDSMDLQKALREHRDELFVERYCQEVNDILAPVLQSAIGLDDDRWNDYLFSITADDMSEQDIMHVFRREFHKYIVAPTEQSVRTFEGEIA